MDAHVAKPIDWPTLFGALDRLVTPARARPQPAAGAVGRSGAAPVLEESALQGLARLLGRPRLAAMIATFMRETPRRLDELQRAGAGAEELRTHAHALVALAGQFGFIELSRLCAEIEQEARRGEGMERLDELRAAVERAVRAAAASSYATAA
jgi:HPt (histidine-containing phosphotransfer) domain-containing protein